MMQLYDYDEIMRVHDIGENIQGFVTAAKKYGASFADVVKDVVEQFKVSQTHAENEVKEYWR